MPMINFGTILAFILGLLIIFVSAKIFFAPLKFILKLIANSVIGAIILYLINLLQPILNIYIGVNPVSALTVGILGVPGLCLLLLLQIFF